MIKNTLGRSFDIDFSENYGIYFVIDLEELKGDLRARIGMLPNKMAERSAERA